MSTLKITFDNSLLSNSKQLVNIGFTGTGSILDSSSKPLAMIDSGVTSKKDFKGNWYTLSDLKDGVTTNGFSGRVHVCYGEGWVPLQEGYFPPPLVSTDVNYDVVHDKFEITFDGSPTGCADLTSIDFWAIPMNLISLNSGTQVSEVKGVHSSSSISDIYSALEVLSNPVQSSESAKALYKDAVAAGMNPPELNPKSAVLATDSKFLRIVGPNTYPSFGDPAQKEMMGLPFTPYNTFEQYLDYLILNFGPTTATGTKEKGIIGLGKGVIAKLSGKFGGNPSAPQTNLTKPQTYDFTVTIDEDMNLTLTGSGSVVGSQVLKISKWEALTPSGMYGGNATFSINGVSQSPQNDIHGWILGDLFAGFNIGAIGCDQSVGGEVVGAMVSSDWFSKLNSSNMFAALWPNHTNFYNQWAAALVTRSDAYGFAYGERFSAPQLNLDPKKVDTLKVQLLGPVTAQTL